MWRCYLFLKAALFAALHCMQFNVCSLQTALFYATHAHCLQRLTVLCVTHWSCCMRPAGFAAHSVFKQSGLA